MNVELIINPKASDIGDNFIVRRSLPRAEKRMVGPFIFWDHMGPVELSETKEMKVRAHPHIGLATLTFLFSGEIMHRDSLGNEQAIRPGEVNWMTAGRGIVHSERSKPSAPMTLEGIQLWIALPKDSEEIEPSFVHHKASELPRFEYNGAELLLIAGKALEHVSPVPVYSDLFYLKGSMKREENFEFKVKPGCEAALYLTKGKIKVGNDIIEPGMMVIYKISKDLMFETLEQSEFMIFGGEVFPEKRNIWWNFVSSDKEKIEQAKRDWSEGLFPEVINETETIPLPKS